METSVRETCMEMFANNFSKNFYSKHERKKRKKNIYKFNL